MASPPWMKFYPQDWRADEKLRLCSLAARGLWIEMLAIMHRSERYGHLLIGGCVPTDAQLAVQVGAPESEITAMLIELDGAGVFSRSAGGAIYSRRMTRDGKKAENARKNGKKGGNPNLSKNKEKSSWDNQGLKPQDKGGVKPQKPEARSQIPDSSPPPDLALNPRARPDQERSYAFEGSTIRLTTVDFDRWRASYSAIPDLRAELSSLDDWFKAQPTERRKNWFHTVSGSLSRKHQEFLVKANSGEKGLVDVILEREGQRAAASQEG